MDSLINLSFLPDDIKRIIVRLVNRYDDCISMKLISPAWNIIVLHHLEATRTPISLERVHLHSGNIDEADYEKYGPRHDSDDSKQVQMHVIIPDEHLERVGVGHWLKIHEEFDTALELVCSPQKFRVWSASSALASLVLGKKKAERKFGLFKRFFSSCAQIDTLVLDHLKDPYLTVFDAMLSTLGEMRITKLEIKEFDVNENMQERILKMVRKHRIEQITIACCKLDQFSLREFLKKIVKLGTKIDIYEEKYNRRSMSGEFRLHYKFWSKLESQLSLDGVSLHWSYAYDNPTFNKDVMNSEVMSHLSCALSNQRTVAASQPTVSRGFYRALPYLHYYL